MQNPHSPKNINNHNNLASNTSERSLNNSRSRVTNKHKKIKVASSQEYDPDDNIKMIN